MTKSKDQKKEDNGIEEINLDELSMGMSDDYLNAAINDATFLRIGSKIFGSRD